MVLTFRTHWTLSFDKTRWLHYTYFKEMFFFFSRQWANTLGHHQFAMEQSSPCPSFTRRWQLPPDSCGRENRWRSHRKAKCWLQRWSFWGLDPCLETIGGGSNCKSEEVIHSKSKPTAQALRKESSPDVFEFWVVLRTSGTLQSTHTMKLG